MQNKCINKKCYQHFSMPHTCYFKTRSQTLLDGITADTFWFQSGSWFTLLIEYLYICETVHLKLSIEIFFTIFREYRNIKTCFQVSVLRCFKINVLFLLCLGRQLFVLKVQAIKSALFVNKVEVINFCCFNIKGQFLLIVCIITGGRHMQKTSSS